MLTAILLDAYPPTPPAWVTVAQPHARSASSLDPSHRCLQVNNLITTSVLLVRMKRREIAYRARQQGRQASRQQQAAGGTGASEPKKDK
jgi:hypothetical protein